MLGFCVVAKQSSLCPSTGKGLIYGTLKYLVAFTCCQATWQQKKPFETLSQSSPKYSCNNLHFALKGTSVISEINMSSVWDFAGRNDSRLWKLNE